MYIREVGVAVFQSRENVRIRQIVKMGIGNAPEYEQRHSRRYDAEQSAENEGENPHMKKGVIFRFGGNFDPQRAHHLSVRVVNGAIGDKYFPPIRFQDLGGHDYLIVQRLFEFSADLLLDGVAG